MNQKQTVSLETVLKGIKPIDKEAVKAAKAENRIRVVGVDSSQEAVQLMEHGIFQGIVVQKAFKMGYVGVRETVKMLRGEDYKKKKY